MYEAHVFMQYSCARNLIRVTRLVTRLIRQSSLWQHDTSFETIFRNSQHFAIGNDVLKIAFRTMLQEVDFLRNIVALNIVLSTSP